MRERIEGMARHRGLDLDRVGIHVITAPVLRLDQKIQTARGSGRRSGGFGRDCWCWTHW